MRLPLYLYSNKNIAGCIAGIAGVAAYLSGFIGEYWWAIIPAAYGVAALGTPSNKTIDVAFEQEMSDAEILAGLKRLADDAPKALPADIAASVVDVCTMLANDIPLISKKNMPDQVAHDVRMMATQYLPQTLQAYSKLPPMYRNTQRIADDKTATQILGEQVSLLRTRLVAIGQSLSADDANALLTNGRFLREKFGTPDFLSIS